MCDLVEIITQRDESDVPKKTGFDAHPCLPNSTLLRCGQQQLCHGVDFEQRVINKLPHGMLLNNSNLI